MFKLVVRGEILPTDFLQTLAKPTKKGRKKIRRGKQSNAKRNGKQGVHGHTGVSCKFLYVSIRRFKSEADSLYQLIEEQDIDILLLAETKVYTNTAINIKGFHHFLW